MDMYFPFEESAFLRMHDPEVPWEERFGIFEQYRDLIVRVAGYSGYFCDLSTALQEEIITRTEHGGA